MQRISPQRGHSMFKAQQGMTLIELLVAMALGLLVTLAAAAALLVSRQGFFAVDASSQLRDNARYAQDILQRVGVQAGYRNVFLRTGAGNATGLDANPPPSVYGLNNQTRTTTDAWDAGSAWGTGTANAGNNSDILVLRAQTSTSSETSTTSDGTMIDCLGLAPTAIPTSRDDRFISILHVQLSNGEPTLMCTREAASGGFESQPLIQGVESFQVLYGVDRVSPGLAPTGVADSVPDRYLRADQLTVSGNTVATYGNWRRVRSLRIGMVLRSQAGSAVDSSAQTYYPLGTTPSGNGAAQGSGFSTSNDAGSAFTSPEDRRMRQVVTFTVHLRNFQDIETN